MSSKPEVPQFEDFFASRVGVCVYVSVDRHPLRICFDSLDAEGRLEGPAPPRPGAASIAIAVATEGFIACRNHLAPLFEQIAEASGSGAPGSTGRSPRH
jgi:hypothetical protein